jgi:hypothetical protein
MREYLVEMKRKEGQWYVECPHQYFDAETPLEAQQKAQSENPDAVITDVYLRVWEIL